ncbi:hypothetical protein CC80DRAFT_488579 [Byssothecium circinans]|uniref:Uncharacterized protein n=1 Tax=Byssothecium circinans TaxID=147558 RepID=A0A6A5U962_9PLEO|nr:hypothetical protein CC80DRAFT_488579 [Byssothecium circinans]
MKVTFERSGSDIAVHVTSSRSLPIHLRALPPCATWVLVALLSSIFIEPVAAMDDEAYALALPSIYEQHSIGHQPFGSRPSGTFFRFCLLIGGIAFTVSSNILGPLMGITSILWLMMRNDSAIDPRVSWMVFGAWSFFASIYIMMQCRRVYNHRLYIFLSIALASACMSAVALIQRASLQSGLVTVIPPCTSFAAYSVAYFFPRRYQEQENLDA